MTWVTKREARDNGNKIAGGERKRVSDTELKWERWQVLLGPFYPPSTNPRNSRRRKIRSRYYIHGTLGVYNVTTFAPRSSSLHPVLPGSPSRQEGRFRFTLRFARNGATGCQERVLACCILQSETVRPGRHESRKCRRHFPILIFSLSTF